MTHYHSGRRLAIAAGAAATGGALAMLLADPVTTGAWRLDHGLLPIIVAVTIAAGDLVGSALRSRKPLSALGFAGVFALGTILTVYSSVGSQKASSGDKALSVEAHNGAIAEKRAELADARVRRRQAETMADREMTGEACGRRCQDWRKRATEVQSHIAILEVQLIGLGGEKVARPRAEAFATAAAVFGFDRHGVEAAATVLEPFAYSLLLELTAIVAFGYGFAGNRRCDAVADVPVVVRAAVPVPATVAGATLQHCGGNRLRLRPRGAVTRAVAEADIIGLVARGQRLPSQDVLARRWGVHKGTASKWLTDFERRCLVTRVATGRVKQVAAVPLRVVA